ncbi:MAG TPA: hypothetical protein VHV31_10495, partial [Nitrolancea sp.]|nr:hypothetical protein [Nitrolancea sp.]
SIRWAMVGGGVLAIMASAAAQQCAAMTPSATRCQLVPRHEGPHAALLDPATILTWGRDEGSQRWRADNPPPWVVALSWSVRFLLWRNGVDTPHQGLAVDERS